MLAHSRFFIMYIFAPFKSITSELIDIGSPVAVDLWLLIFVNVGITAAAHHVPSNGHMPAMDKRRANICQKKTLIQRR